MVSPDFDPLASKSKAMKEKLTLTLAPTHMYAHRHEHVNVQNEISDEDKQPTLSFLWVLPPHTWSCGHALMWEQMCNNER